MKNKSRVFFQILCSYIMILLIPLVSIAVIYAATSHAIVQNSRRQAEITLSTISDMVDMRTRELQSICTYLDGNTEIIQLLDCGVINYTSTKIYDVYQVSQQMPDFSQTNTMVENTAVILRNGEYILSPGAAIPFNEKFFSICFPNIDYTYREFTEIFLQQYYEDEFIIVPSRGGGVSGEIWYLHTLLTSYAGEPQALVMIRVNTDFFDEIFERLSDEELGMVLIMDESNHVIASSCDPEMEDDFEQAIEILSQEEVPNEWNGYAITQTNSNKNNWSYYYLTPRSGMVTGMESIRTIIGALSICSLVIGAILALGVTRTKARAITKAMESLDSWEISGGLPSKAHNAYSYLETAVKKLVAENMDLSTDIQQQKALIQASSMQKLLTGEYASPEEQKKLLQYVQISWDSLCFRIVILQSRKNERTISDQNLIRMCQKNMITEVFSGNYRFFDTDENRLTILFWSATKEDEILNIDPLLEKVFFRLEHEYGINSAVAIGDIYYRSEDISQAYQESLRIAEYIGCFPDQRILHLGDLPNTQTSYYYPLQIELDLINRIGTGDEPAIRKIFNTLYEENFTQRQLSSTMLCQLNSVIKGSILRGMKDYLIRPDAEWAARKVYQSDTLEDLLVAAVEISRLQHSNQAESKKEQQEELKKKIINYIQQHYSDSSLSVDRAAEDLGMGASALYQFFRENMTTTFGDMLECVRIQTACTLLKQKKESIKVIAQQVGYNSDTSFRRAFKRVMHITPGEYLNFDQNDRKDE